MTSILFILNNTQKRSIDEPISIWGLISFTAQVIASMQYLVSLGFLSVSIRRINLVSFGSDIELDQSLAILNVSVFLLDFVSFILVGVSFQKDLLQDYSDIVTLIYFACMLID